MAKVETTINAESALNRALDIDGATAAMIVDYNSGMSLGSAGGGIDLDVAAAGNTQVVRAKMDTIDELGLEGSIEDILITLDYAYHVIRPLPGSTLFFYLVLDRKQANLAMARYKLTGIVKDLVV